PARPERQGTRGPPRPAPSPARPGRTHAGSRTTAHPETGGRPDAPNAPPTPSCPPPQSPTPPKSQLQPAHRTLQRPAAHPTRPNDRHARRNRPHPAAAAPAPPPAEAPEPNGAPQQPELDRHAPDRPANAQYRHWPPDAAAAGTGNGSARRSPPATPPHRADPPRRSAPGSPAPRQRTP